MAQWPSNLPQSPLIDGFSRQKRQNRREFQPEGGKSTSVLFYTAVPDVLEISLYLRGEQQRQDFEDFYDNTLLFGTQPFDFTDPQTGTVGQFRFVGSQPEFDPSGFTDFIVSFTLEKLP